jgi:drug/metabolite transporter (DMT)-like permease
MDTWHVAAALLSAVLHAGWNAAVKAGSEPRELMTAQMVASAVIVLPGLAWSGLPASASWPWIAGSTSMTVLTVMALLRAYEAAGFGIAYPIVRALAVVLVVPLAAILSAETPSAYGMAGIGLVAASLLMLAIGRRGRAALPRRAMAWIALAGLSAAAYVLCDARGVRSAGSPWAYGFVVSITNGAAMLCLQHASGSWRRVARHALPAMPIALASVASYLLILWVLSGAPVAPAAALRDTSAVFALIIAVVWLKEPITRLQVLAILLSAAAVPLLRFS